jgi:hypothetical protein
VLGCRATKNQILNLFNDVNWCHKVIRLADSDCKVMESLMTSITSSV